MKFTAIILLSACLTASAKGFSQITLAEKNAPLQKIFKEIQKQSGYDFLFSYTLLEKAGNVTVTVKNVSLQQAVEEVLKGKNLTYEILEKTVVIKPKSESPNEEATPKPINIDIKGRVVNENSEPVQATVTVKGTLNAAATDVDGNFTLKDFDENATLVITGVGIETREVKLNGRKDIIITVKIKVGGLQEVIVNKGYYTEKQKFSTGNVSTVTSKDIEKQPVNNPLLALEGRVPGLVVTQVNGISGGGVKISIQGKNSIVRGNEPLIIVDGIPFPSQLPSTGVGTPFGGPGDFGGSGSPLAFVNPSDIQSIDVLKDADATSIYGSRAANGAIIITTKKGAIGKAKLNINVQSGWGKVGNMVDMLNTRQYLDMRYEAYKNDNATPSLNGFPPAYDLLLWDTTRYTNWQKELIGGTAQYFNANASVSGGNSNIQYLFGSTYNRHSSVFPGDFADKKATVYFNLSAANTNGRFRFELTGNYLTGDNKLPGYDLTQTAILTEPVAPALYNADGSLNWAPDPNGYSTWSNPLSTTLIEYNNKTKNLISNVRISYVILPGLVISSNAGYSDLETKDFRGNPISSIIPDYRSFIQRSADYGQREIKNWIMEPQINFTRDLSIGKVDMLIGATINQINTEGSSVTGKGYNSDAVLRNIAAASNLTVGTSYMNRYKYNAIYGRINYALHDKYVINLTGRRDGSSRFGSANQFHNFWSSGVSWIFSNEKWFDRHLNFLSFGKIKGSYGTTGSDQINDYAFMSLYSPVTDNVSASYQGINALSPTNIGNPYLQWEETKKISIGMDLGFLNDRIFLSSSYSQNRSSNQLLFYSLPSITGFSAIARNFPATVENTSWEFVLNTENLKGKEITWTSTINLTIPRNKLVSFPNLESSSYSNSLIIGEPLDFTRLFRFGGVDPATGRYQNIDIHGNLTFNPSSDDMSLLSSNFPKFYGGIQNAITYKNFQLDFLFQYVKQKASDFYFSNGQFLPGVFYSGFSNQPVTVLDRWQKPGDNTNIRKFTSNFFASFSDMYQALASDANNIDASYLRLKNLSISWQFPQSALKKMRLQKCRLYLQGQNLLTFTKFRGPDPESLSIGALPPLRMITAGLQIGL